MGEIKQQLAAEAEADALAAAGAFEAPASAPAVVAPEILARLDQIDAQLAAILSVIGAAPGPTEALVAAELPPVEAAPASEPAQGEAVAPDPVEAAVAEATAPEWTDEVSYTLNPGEGIEVKLAMEKGQTARFAWTANGGVENFDMHGDGSGEKISYEQGRAVPEQAGELIAAFTGNHGWFWRNRTDAPVTVTLRTAGDYADLKAP
jgi:hypothetical protein